MNNLLKNKLWLVLSIVVIFALAITAATFAAQSPSPSPTASPSPSPTATPAASPSPSPTASPAAPVGAPPEVTQYANDWPMTNKDYSQTRVANSTINSSNVNTLGIAWQFEVPGVHPFLGAAAGINPLVLGNNIYFQDMKANLFVLDKQTGQVKMRKDYNSDSTIGPYGPAVGYGKIFILKDLYTVAALDINNLNELWATTLSDVPTTGIDIQVTVYDNLVYVSTVPGAGDVFYTPGGRGVLYALDQQTGEIVWQFDTVKSPDLFGHPDVNSGGGAWYPPAIDTATGQMFWSIANPAPFPGTEEWPNGTSYEGDTLYTDTLVSMDHATGQLTWYNQVLPFDIFDHDLQISPVLATITLAGKPPQDVVITAGKMGKVYCIDRDTGALIWQVAVGEHNQASEMRYLPEGETFVLPGVIGGVETPMAYDDGILYVPVIDYGQIWTPSEIVTPFDAVKGEGQLVAIDVNIGRILWAVEFDYMDVAAATVVNDLVFTADLKGNMFAFNKETGEQVWTFRAPAGINAYPAIVGDTIYWPAAAVGEISGVSGTPYLIALRLGAAPTATPTPSPSPSPSPSPTASPAASPSPTASPSPSPSPTASPSPTISPSPSPSPTPSPSPSPSPTASPSASVTVNLTAQNLAFNMSTITVPAGATVRVNFNNMDASIPHNFAVYTNSSATTPVFVGQTITGPSSTTYNFTAPTTPGTYFFRCDVHPTLMTGSFVVTQ